MPDIGFDSETRRLLVSLWESGIRAVNGRTLVRQALNGRGLGRVHIAAVGKAASEMADGAIAALGRPERLLVVTKHDHLDHGLAGIGTAMLLEAGHPFPDHNSLRAGQALLDFVESVPAADTLLLLVSGGASALVEVLRDGMTLEDLRAFTDHELASGAIIQDINRRRIAVSLIKGGRLLPHAKCARIEVLVLADVPEGVEEIVGSGIGARDRSADRTVSYAFNVVGTNNMARSAICRYATAAGLPIVEEGECLYGDVGDVAKRMAEKLEASPAGLYVWGGEPTVALPPHPGRGGRAQSLAVALGLRLKGTCVSGLVAGSDGTDGPTDAAGGFFGQIGAGDLRAAEEAYEKADAGPWLETNGLLFKTGPTGTNVMDLLVAVKGSMPGTLLGWRPSDGSSGWF